MKRLWSLTFRKFRVSLEILPQKAGTERPRQPAKGTCPRDPFRGRIRARLLEDGFSFRSWADRHGFKVQTVHTVLRRYVTGDRKIKRSRAAHKIIRQLERDTGLVIRRRDSQ